LLGRGFISSTTPPPEANSFSKKGFENTVEPFWSQNAISLTSSSPPKIPIPVFKLNELSSFLSLLQSSESEKLASVFYNQSKFLYFYFLSFIFVEALFLPDPPLGF
jgi:hypothetical protein